MPRRKAARNCTILPWLSAKLDDKEGRFVQIGNSLLLSEKFQSLPYGAKYLYLCMAMESGGHRKFTFTAASAKKYGMADTFLRREEKVLEAAGMITKISGKNVRLPNEYEFDYRWKLGGDEGHEPKDNRM